MHNKKESAVSVETDSKSNDDAKEVLTTLESTPSANEESSVEVTIPVRAIIPVKFRRADDHLYLVASHAYWKEKICEAIENKGTLDDKEIFKDDSCDLGRWLHCEDDHPHVSHLQSYHDLKKRNAEFHVQASRVAEYVNAKKYDAAKRLTECTSAFESASNAVIMAIFRLKKDFDIERATHNHHKTPPTQ